MPTKQKRITRDNLWKSIIEDYFKEFVCFFFARHADQIDFDRPFEFLDKELAELFPESVQNTGFVDKLVKVWLKDGTETWFLVHIEVQGQKDPLFPQRMHQYFYRIYDRYGVQITAIAILTDSIKSWKPDSYDVSFMGTNYYYQYNVYKLATQDRAALAADDNLFALIMLVAYDALQRTKTDDEKLQIKVSLSRALLARGYTSKAIRDILLFIKHYTRFEDSKYLRTFDLELNQILHQPLQQPMGIQEYIMTVYREEGREEGRQEGIEKGISLKERDFTLNLWRLQEMPFDKIVLLVGVTEQQVTDTIIAHLTEQGKTQEEALAVLAAYQEKMKPSA